MSRWVSSRRGTFAKLQVLIGGQRRGNLEGFKIPRERGVYEILLEHEVRRWSAEEENSRRHASRVNLLLTASAAFAGVGLFELAPDLLEAKVQLLFVWWFVALLALVAAMACFVLSALLALQVVVQRVDHTEPLPSSFWLSFDKKTLAVLPEPMDGPERLSYECFWRTSLASTDLMERNHRHQGGISRSQSWLWKGILCAFLSLLVYTAATP
ncbi:MAG TPA: hypothetical protein VM599_08160 [Thermoanaerobaculia bacterium]|nr:hypothetical protein [Thermoanaerobaculia bacterium]